MIVKANSFASMRWALCVGAFGALFSACMPDGTSPELPIMQAGAGGASGFAAGSGAAGSSAGSSAAGSGVSSGTAGRMAMAGRSGGAAGSSTSPAMGGSGAGGSSMGMGGRSGTAGAMGAAGSMGMAGRMATAGMGAGGMGGSMAMAGRGGMGGSMAMAGMGGMGGAAAGGAGGAAGGGATAATFTEVYGLINTGCSCHVSGSPGNLSMSNKMTAYMNLVGANSQACGGQKRVAAGDPNNSVLFHSIDRSMLGSCMVPAMPAGGMAKWPQANIDKVKAWIMAGAMNN